MFLPKIRATTCIIIKHLPQGTPLEAVSATLSEFGPFVDMKLCRQGSVISAKVEFPSVKKAKECLEECDRTFVLGGISYDMEYTASITVKDGLISSWSGRRQGKWHGRGGQIDPLLDSSYTEPKFWNCEKCFVTNKFNARHCVQCGAERPREIRAEMTNQKESLPSDKMFSKDGFGEDSMRSYASHHQSSMSGDQNSFSLHDNQFHTHSYRHSHSRSRLRSRSRSFSQTHDNKREKRVSRSASTSRSRSLSSRSRSLSVSERSRSRTKTPHTEKTEQYKQKERRHSTSNSISSHSHSLSPSDAHSHNHHHHHHHHHNHHKGSQERERDFDNDYKKKRVLETDEMKDEYEHVDDDEEKEEEEPEEEDEETKLTRHMCSLRQPHPIFIPQLPSLSSSLPLLGPFDTPFLPPTFDWSSLLKLHYSSLSSSSSSSSKASSSSSAIFSSSHQSSHSAAPNLSSPLSTTCIICRMQFASPSAFLLHRLFSAFHLYLLSTIISPAQPAPSENREINQQAQ